MKETLCLKLDNTNLTKPQQQILIDKLKEQYKHLYDKFNFLVICSYRYNIKVIDGECFLEIDSSIDNQIIKSNEQSDKNMVKIVEECLGKKPILIYGKIEKLKEIK